MHALGFFLSLFFFAQYTNNPRGFWVIPNLLATSGESNRSRARILDADNGCGQGCLDLAAFKAEVGIQHFAVNQLEPLAIAKRLRTNDFAIYKRHVLAVPREVFPLDGAVAKNHVFGVPKGILGVKIAVLKIGVCDVLERIFSYEFDPLEAQALGAHHEIFAYGRRICHLDAANHPAEFGRNDVAIGDGDIRALTQSLGAVELAIDNFDALAIPKSRTTKGSQLAFFDFCRHVVPKRIAQIEIAAPNFNVAALLECALAIGRTIKGAVLHTHILNAVKRTLGIKGLILYQVHFVSLSCRLKILCYIIAHIGEEIKRKENLVLINEEYISDLFLLLKRAIRESPLQDFL